MDPAAPDQAWWKVLAVQGAAMVDVLIKCGQDNCVLAAAGGPAGSSFPSAELNAAITAGEAMCSRAPPQTVRSQPRSSREASSGTLFEFKGGSKPPSFRAVERSRR